MKHNEKVKLFAAYMNGCAVAFFAVGCLNVVWSLLITTEPMTFYKGISYVVFLVGSVACHLAGRSALNKLEE